MNEYSYVRVSTDIQERKKTYKTQQFQINKALEREKVQLTKEFKDLASSGKDMNRVGIHELIDELIENPQSRLWIVDQDRLTRNPADWLLLQDILLETQTTIIGIESAIDISTEEGQLLGEIKSSLNKYFRLKTNRKVKMGIERFKKENDGKWGRKPKIKDKTFQYWYTTKKIRNKTQLAKILGVSRKTLYNYLKKNKIE